MPTPMHVFYEIAVRHGADPTDEEAIDKWFQDVLPTLPAAKRQDIFDEMMAREDEPEPVGYVPPKRTYPMNVPMPTLEESPPAKPGSRRKP